MKILAVIPARAGSRGIPNKNIRLINGKPLIWYAINNACTLKAITDIVVTTDSYQVGTIAKQMGVSVCWRTEELCKDNITLDEVVYDALQSTGKEFDYVITMQPTSPTLSSRTLEEAIAFTINNNLDTVISVHNEPHLSWRSEKAKIVPNYKERLNRQYLPAHYMETGAFIISKSSCVHKHSRIGQNISVFEVTDSESVDIDTFADMKVAELLLNQKKIGIYVNGNLKRGIGHVYRALELADEFYVKPDIFFDLNQTDVGVFGDTTHTLVGVNGIGELLKILEEKQYDIFINDILNTSIDYMIAIRQALPNAKLVNFEDEGEGCSKADLVINALYEDVDTPNMKYGESLFICSKLFMFYNPINVNKCVKNVFVSFGGADPQGYTDRILKFLIHPKYKNISFKVVLGRSKKNIQELMEYNQYSNIDVLYDVKNMPEIMQSCDIAISSRGRTSYELTIMGIPTIVMSQNEREEHHSFINNQNGFIYLGLNPSDYVIESNLDMLIGMGQEDRLKYQNRLLMHDLKNGRKRVLDLIFQ